MPTATIHTLFCVRHATGTDVELLDSLFAALPTALLGSVVGGALVEAVRGIPEVISAIDVAGGSPDDLFITTGSNQIDDALWPGNGETLELAAGQSAAPNVSVEFEGSLNISLFDEDVSSNDLLASITIFSAEQGQGEIAKFGSSDVEHSAYYVIYSVE